MFQYQDLRAKVGLVDQVLIELNLDCTTSKLPRKKICISSILCSRTIASKAYTFSKDPKMNQILKWIPSYGLLINTKPN